MGRLDRDSASGRDTGVVRSVDRALSLLETISAQSKGLSLLDLARRAKLPASTTHRLLTTLQQRGFARFDAGSGRWQVGRVALGVGANYAGSRDLVAIARPILQRISADCGEIFNLGIIDDGKVVFLHRADPRASKSYVPTGTATIPLHCSSIGKMLLALLPAHELRQVLCGQKLAPMTPNTVVSERALRQELETANRNGFAIDDEENTMGLRCIAAPVFDEYHRPVAAISLAAPTDRLKKRHVAESSVMVRAAATELTRAWSGLPV